MVSALTIAGSDSGGGAGIQADLKTFEAHGIFGTSAITALTAQNTVGVQDVMGVPPTFVAAQIQSVLTDFTIGAAKTGMLFNTEIIEVVVAALSEVDFPIVVDPVMVSTSGHRLLQPAAEELLQKALLPLATLITPNREEGALLAGMDIPDKKSMEIAAQKMLERYPGTAILQKGGHFVGNTADDLLLLADGTQIWFSMPFVNTPNTHGTGCALSAAITANLANGMPLTDSVREAKIFLTQALEHSWAHAGKGNGSLRHNFRLTQYEI